jgi:putative lipoprotein
MPSPLATVARSSRPLATIFVALTLAACAITRDNVPTPAMATITGTVTYAARIALPPDTVVKVVVADVTATGAPAVPIANLSFVTEGRQVPLPFSLRFDTGRLDASRSYAITARIEQEGRPLFVSDQPTRIDPKAPPTNLELVVAPVPPGN